MSDYISRADAIEAVQKIVPYVIDNDTGQWGILVNKANVITELSALPSADAVQKWNCTANFVAEQLDRLRNMTDEEKWEFFRKFFGMGDAVQGEWVDVENEPYCECSVCGSYIDNLDDDYAFCPRCGARMKGGDGE